MKSRVSIGSIHVLPYVNSWDCVEKFGIQTRVYTGSEHVKSGVLIGSIHILPFVNSQDSVYKVSVQTSV